MPCSRVGADVLDSTEQDVYNYDSMEAEDTWWELTPEQRAHFEALKHMNSYLREEYHAIHELLWKSNQVTLYSEMPARYVQVLFFETFACISLHEYIYDVSYFADLMNLITRQTPAVFTAVWM